MDKVLDQQVRLRAGNICEYCRMPQFGSRLSLVIDHIIARQHAGLTTIDNLALACGHCNRHKGPNIAGNDPVTGELSRLFNPRLQVWGQEFRWRGALIEGTTPCGRTTVHVLYLNDSIEVAARESLILEGILRTTGAE